MNEQDGRPNRERAFPVRPEPDRALSLLGLARKAGKLELGADPAAEAMQEGRACLLLLARDLSPRSAGNASQKARETRVPALQVPWTMDRIGAALGKRSGILAVCDGGFAGKLRALLPEQARSTEEESYTDDD